MLAQAVESYVAVRRAAGFAFKSEGCVLRTKPITHSRRSRSPIGLNRSADASR